MMKVHFYLLVILVLIASGCTGEQEETTARLEDSKHEKVETTRIVSLNGSVSEILAELGLGDQIVGTDVTSTYPEFIAALPKVGHSRNISVEGVFSLDPTIIIGTANDIDPTTKEQFEAAGAKIILMEQEYSLEGTKTLINEVAIPFDKTEEANALKNKVEADLKVVTPVDDMPKVLFVYARGAGTLMVAGDETQMKTAIEMAGGINAIEGFTGFKPLTAEAVVEANPDYILMFSSGLESLEGENGLLQVPGIAQTKAGQEKKFITMDGQYLSGFGPRLGKAIQELAEALKG